MGKIKKTKQLYEPLNMTTQLIFSNLAESCIGYFPDKIYFLIEAYNVLKSDVKQIETKLKKTKDYDKLEKFQLISSVIKTHYDFLKGSQITKSDPNDIDFVRYQKAMSHLPLITPKIYEIFFDAIKMTKLKDFSIPNETLKRAERTYKSFEPREEQYAKEINEDYEDEE